MCFVKDTLTPEGREGMEEGEEEPIPRWSLQDVRCCLLLRQLATHVS